MTKVQWLVGVRGRKFNHDLLAIGGQLTVAWISMDRCKDLNPDIVLQHQVEKPLHYVITRDNPGISDKVFTYDRGGFRGIFTAQACKRKAHQRMRPFKFPVSRLDLQVLCGHAKKRSYRVFNL